MSYRTGEFILIVRSREETFCTFWIQLHSFGKKMDKAQIKIFYTQGYKFNLHPKIELFLSVKTNLLNIGWYCLEDLLVRSTRRTQNCFGSHYHACTTQLNRKQAQRLEFYKEILNPILKFLSTGHSRWSMVVPLTSLDHSWHLWVNSLQAATFNE